MGRELMSGQVIEASTGAKGVTESGSVELETACRTLAVQARTTARRMALARAAAALRARSAEILEANARDVAAAPGLGLNAAAVDRLSLDARRVDELAGSLLQVLALPDPIGEVVSASRRPNGLEVSQVRVPLGVIFMI